MLKRKWYSLYYFLTLTLSLLSANSWGLSYPIVRGFNLTEDGRIPLDANPSATRASEKTEAQKAVDHIQRLGGNHVILNPRAIMKGPFLNEIIPLTPTPLRAQEREGYLRLIRYIHSLKMTVGIRPIFFVVRDETSLAPFEEVIVTNGQRTVKRWWHGNIRPSNPERWFESFRSYLETYMLIAKLAQAEEFTLGAELYSMTVGIEDQWLEYPHGFPGKWVQLLQYARSKLPVGTRIMYDINFTDDHIQSSGGLQVSGGELERWRYRLVDLAPRGPRDEHNRWWFDLAEFWKGLNAVGIDMYRSLADANSSIPTDYSDLVQMLQTRTDSYAQQLDTTVLEIAHALQFSQNYMFKEIGYRSAEKGFVDPFNYATTSSHVNLLHQAAAYEAFFNSFWSAHFDWLTGVNFWEILVSPQSFSENNAGFSPVYKQKTEQIIMQHFKGDH